MKFRHALIFVIATILLTACNFTLAADVTPPPGYVPPTPMPTLGPLYPTEAPDLQNGAAIYAEKCAACHGVTGLGDGPDGKELPVTVAALGLPETAHKATPARWFTVVTQGNIERFMPPFVSLNDQERWDVISYALTLHTTQEQIEQGQAIFEEKCGDCAALFSEQEKMSSLSADDLVRIMKNGEGDIPAFGADLSDEDAYAVVTYLRSLTFGEPQVAQAGPTTVPTTPTAAAVLETPAATDAGTGTTEATPAEGTPQATPSEVAAVVETPAANTIGTITGLIDNQTGDPLPEDLKITVRAFDHGGDPNAGPQEVAALEATAEADGVYTITDVEIPERRIFVAELELGGITYQSDFSLVEAGATEVTLPDIVIYATTDDFSGLTVDTLQIFFDYANEDSVQVFAVYSIMNTTDKTVALKMGAQDEVPFIKFPDGASGQGYEEVQDSAGIVGTADGLALPPNTLPYKLIAFASYPRDSKLEFSQTVSIPVTNALVFLPEGVTA
ncbi:MAG: c-type cytochrome, partial [Chloroflexota bacterium]